MINIPECKHRTELDLKNQRCVCNSKCLIKRRDTVSLNSCKNCGVENKDCVPIKIRGPIKKGLGDRLAHFLRWVGITTVLIQKVTGKPCGCKKRQERLNRLGEWIAKIWSRL